MSCLGLFCANDDIKTSAVLTKLLSQFSEDTIKIRHDSHRSWLSGDDYV